MIFFFHPDCFFKAVFRGTSVKEYNWDGEKTLTNSSFQVPWNKNLSTEESKTSVFRRWFSATLSKRNVLFPRCYTRRRSKNCRFTSTIDRSQGILIVRTNSTQTVQSNLCTGHILSSLRWAPLWISCCLLHFLLCQKKFCAISHEVWGPHFPYLLIPLSTNGAGMSSYRNCNCWREVPIACKSQFTQANIYRRQWQRVQTSDLLTTGSHIHTLNTLKSIEI